MTIRQGPKVDRARHEDLGAALDAVEAASRRAARRDAVRSIGRDFSPEQLVALRAEVRGPGGVSGGIDVRGDGTAVAYTGRLLRRPLEPRDGETPQAALRRALSGGSTSVDP